MIITERFTINGREFIRTYSDAGRYANTLTGASDPDLISAAETLIEQRIKEG